MVVACNYAQSGGKYKVVWGKLTPVALNIFRRRTALHFCISGSLIGARDSKPAKIKTRHN